MNWITGAEPYSARIRIGGRRAPACSLLNIITVAGHDILSTMKIIRSVIVALALSAVGFATSACPEKGPVQKAGEKVDKAIDKTKDAVK